MKIVILDSMTFGSDVSLEKLKSLGEVVVYEKSTADEAAVRVKDANVIIVNKVLMNEQTLKDASDVKMIAVTATGYNNIDLEYAKKRGIRVANVAGYSTDSVVQHTFALMFYVMEKLSYYDEYVKSGEYSKCPVFTHFDKVFMELKGKTWGIIGLGAIGRGVAQVAQAFGTKVIYYSASGHTYDCPYRAVTLDELLAQSDIISVHAPLNDKTRNLMNYDAFCKMKKNAILINVGRGPIVNETDLVRALNEDRISGAGLDVVCTEPIPADSPLMQIKDSTKLIVTPHIAWATYEARTRLLDEVYENIAAYVRGEERNTVV